ncbi:MAG: hypothetical protein HQ515_16635 [Phycisphaeraceae bacterium]|nr:hypothetical protein [Phycisphaeraceae bacterium]
MNRKKPEYSSLFRNAEIYELEMLEGIKAFEAHGKMKQKRGDAGVRRHRNNHPTDKWSSKEDHCFAPKDVINVKDCAQRPQ